MKINLTDGYYITEDNYNYILMQDYVGVARKSKESKQQTRTVGYYSNGIKGLKGCIKRYLEECSLDAGNSNYGTLMAFCEHLEQIINDKADQIMWRMTYDGH